MKQEQSPFAALTPQQQKEQWICWQAARQRACCQPESLPELHLPKPEKPVPPPPAPPVRHSQYDAIVRRMKQARCQARGDHRWD